MIQEMYDSGVVPYTKAHLVTSAQTDIEEVIGRSKNIRNREEATNLP